MKYNQTYRQEQIDKKAVDAVLIRRLWHYLRPYRFWIFVAIAFLLLSKVIEAFVPIAIGRVTQKILDSVHLVEDKQAILTTVINDCIIIIFLLIFSYMLDSLNVILKSWVGQKALYQLRTSIYRHIEQMPLQYFNKHSVGRLMTRTIHDVDQINQLFAESIIPILGSAMLFICISIGIIIVDWRLACLVAIVVAAAWWLTEYFRINERRCYDMIRGIVSAMNTFVQEHLMGVSTIRSFGLQKREREIFEEINQDHCTAYMESIHYFSVFFAGIDILQSLTLIMVFALLVLFAPPDTGFQAGTFFTFSLYALMFFRPLSDLAERYNVLQSAMAASERIFNVLDHSAEPQGPASFPPLEEIKSIDFEDVWFAYEDENWVLKGLTLHIEQGESVALVGVTGAGKTSIMSLLLRFYDYQKGSIKINGEDIRKYPLNVLRKQFSVVLQDPVILSGTIAENISLYDPEITPEQIYPVIDYLGMKSFIEQFPEKLDHMLTERGKTLSVGEMQLISMARAVAYKRSMLILDEATANIDTATEKIIQNALKKMLEGKTAMVIAHRLSTIKDVSRIVVLHNGAVVESGTHKELIKLGGIYEKLYRLQYLET